MDADEAVPGWMVGPPYHSTADLPSEARIVLGRREHNDT